MKCTNPYLLVSLFLLSGAPHGSFDLRPSFWHWEGNCVVCGKKTQWTQDLFCGNFSNSVGTYAKCLNTWCPGCYTSSPKPKFHFAGGKEGVASLGEDVDRLESGWRTGQFDPSRFNVARKGDHLMCPFECDVCVFRKLRSRSPLRGSEQDVLLLACIRRVNLDAFWARAPTTVKANASKVKLVTELSQELGLAEPPLHAPGPFPFQDTCGVRVAVLSVFYSLRQGKHDKSHLQYDTVRRLRSAVANQYQATARLAGDPAFGTERKLGSMRLSYDPCDSLWFSRWSTGCRKRMGQDWRPDLAISPEIMQLLLAECRIRMDEASTTAEIQEWTMAGSYFCMCYVLSLRGSEGLLLDLGALTKYNEPDARKTQHVVFFPLLGRIKGEDHSRHHLLASVHETSSGVTVKIWQDMLVRVHSFAGYTDGPAFIDVASGLQDTTHAMTERLRLPGH